MYKYTKYIKRPKTTRRNAVFTHVHGSLSRAKEETGEDSVDPRLGRRLQILQQLV